MSEGRVHRVLCFLSASGIMSHEYVKFVELYSKIFKLDLD
jgi:hypothetical protein